MAKSDERYDKTVADTFPASDPPANSGITGPDDNAGRAPQKPFKSGDEDRPTGRPTSDRHDTEVAHHSQTDTVMPPKQK
jgi:hypothetical protein